MNRTKIEWTDFTWNPITGCLHGCWYCYAKRMFTRFGRSFEPTFHPERLEEPYALSEQPDTVKVFVCSVSDLFAPWTPAEWRDQVLTVGEDPELSHIIFQLLTKQPHLIPLDHVFPENVWVGATVTHVDEIHKIDEIKRIEAGVRFVSFEPLLSNFPGVRLTGLDWIIIGKLTGSRRVKLDPAWVETLLECAIIDGIPVFVKNNVNWLKKIQEFPSIFPKVKIE